MNTLVYDCRVVDEDSAGVLDMFVTTSDSTALAAANKYMSDKVNSEQYNEYGLYYGDKLVGCIISFSSKKNIVVVTCLNINKGHRLQTKMFIDKWHDFARETHGTVTVRCLANSLSLPVLTKLGYNVKYTAMYMEL